MLVPNNFSSGIFVFVNIGLFATNEKPTYITFYKNLNQMNAWSGIFTASRKQMSEGPRKKGKKRNWKIDSCQAMSK